MTRELVMELVALIEKMGLNDEEISGFIFGITRLAEVSGSECIDTAFRNLADSVRKAASGDKREILEFIGCFN